MWLVITIKRAQLFRRECLHEENYKGRLRFAKRWPFCSHCSLGICAAVLIQGRLLFESFFLAKRRSAATPNDILSALLLFHLNYHSNTNMLSYTAINIQEKTCLAFTGLLFCLLHSIPNSSVVYFLKMLSWGKRNKYPKNWLWYFLAHCANLDCLIIGAYPGFVGPKDYTIRGKNYYFKKRIPNYKFSVRNKTKMNISL